MQNVIAFSNKKNNECDTQLNPCRITVFFKCHLLKALLQSDVSLAWGFKSLDPLTARAECWLTMLPCSYNSHKCTIPKTYIFSNLIENWLFHPMLHFQTFGNPSLALACGERKDARCLYPLLIVHYVGNWFPWCKGSPSASEHRGSEARESSPPLMSSWHTTLCMCLTSGFVRLLRPTICTSIVSEVKGIIVTAC